MIEVSITQMLIIVGFLGGSCLSLIVFIYNNQARRIDKLEKVQVECPISKTYTIIELVRRDVDWIKRALGKKN